MTFFADSRREHLLTAILAIVTGAAVIFLVLTK